jgi:hypothetical protein
MPVVFVGYMSEQLVEASPSSPGSRRWLGGGKDAVTCVGKSQVLGPEGHIGHTQISESLP